MDKCAQLELKPGPPPNFDQRLQSDRFEAGTRPVLLRNASIWTGGLNGREVIRGDILLDKGLIKAIGTIDTSNLKEYKDLLVSNLAGAWVCIKHAS